MAERGLIPGLRHSRVALLVVATDEEMMVTQHATALLRANRREGNRRKNGLMTLIADAPTHNQQMNRAEGEMP